MVDKCKILKELKTYKNFNTDTQFAQFLGISTQNLSAWYKRNTFDENKIVDNFPEVNKVWLLTGEGEMLKESRQNKEIVEVKKGTQLEIDFSKIASANEKLANSVGTMANSVEKIAGNNTTLVETNAKITEKLLSKFEEMELKVSELSDMLSGKHQPPKGKNRQNAKIA